MAPVLVTNTGASVVANAAHGDSSIPRMRSEGSDLALEETSLGHALFASSGEEDFCHRNEDAAPPKPSCPVLTTSMVTHEQAPPAADLVKDTIKPASYDANKETEATEGPSTSGKGAPSTFGPHSAMPAIRADRPSTAAAAAPPKPRRRCILVAKCLTNSDASSGRIILPRMAVETNLPFVTAYRHYALAVRDSTGRRYEFVVKSWANGTEHRRVFVLEQVTEFLRAHGIGVGDTVGICTDENGELVVEANSEAVRQASVSPRYGAALMAAPAAAASAVPLASIATGRCARSVHCSKAAGHAGFCSGPKAAAAAAASAAAKACRRSEEAALSESAASESPPAEGAAAADAEYSSDETAVTTVALHPPPALLSQLPPDLHLHPLAHLPAGLRLAKRLTPYDIASRRAILPADDVYERVPNAGAADLLSLAAVDESQGWQFLTLRAWRSVTGRRGYALEDAHGFLEARGACAGDELVVYRHADLAPPRIEVRAGGDAKLLRHPPRPDAALTFAQLPVLLLPPEIASYGAGAGQRAPADAAGGAPMVCHRIAGCTKAAGHQGFCSGHKGFKRKDGGSGSGTPTSRQHHRLAARGAHHAASAYFGGGFRRDRERYDDDEEWGSDEEYVAPAKRPRRSAANTPRASLAGSPHSTGDPLLSLLSLLGS